MQILGVDPHKGSHTAAAVAPDGTVLGRTRVVSSRRQAQRLIAWAAPWPERVWAVEGATGVGRLLAQQLVAAGESVLDVPAALATRVRVLSGQSGRKTDAHDAVAVATAAIHHPRLRAVQAEDHNGVLRLLSVRRTQLTASRTQAVSRLHGLLAELIPGGAPKNLDADHAAALLRSTRPSTAVDATRKALARDLVDDVRRIDRKLDANKADIVEAVKASGTTLTEIQGIAEITAAKILGQTGRIDRFEDRAHYASYAGVAPIEASSGAISRHRLSRRGNRQLNSAMHGIAITQATHPGRGREFYLRKRDEGKTEGEARRALKRHIIDLVFATITADTERAQRSPGRQVGATRESSAAGQSPTANTSERSVPGLRKEATTDAA
jgi:transposase